MLSLWSKAKISARAKDGIDRWSAALETLGSRGRLVFFGTLTGGKVDLDLNKLYSIQARIIGTTGGSDGIYA
jgi:NADPH:quinone reductase-like Zn-dependent oxidoreductase